MPRKPQVSVEPRPDGRWAVQTDGTQRAYRVTDGKAEATSIARQVARNKATELVIKNERGHIVAKNSYGNDSPNVKG